MRVIRSPTHYCNCGRLADRTPTQRAFDEYARFFRLRSSPKYKGLNVGQATDKYNAEHYQFVVRRANGEFETQVLQVARPNQTRVTVRLPKLEPGDSAVVMHTHFGGPGAEHLSDVDIAFGHGTGLPIYKIGPGPSYRIDVYENSLHTITRIPSW